MSLLTDSTTVLFGRGAGFLIQFIAGAILARLLTPDEFGVFSVAAGAASMLYALREFGSTNYLVRADAVDRDTVGSVLLVSFSLSSLLGGVLALSAGWVAAFFADQRIAPLLYIIAANFLLVPLGLLGNALLVREERFFALTVVNTGSAFAGALTMILLALAGAGPIALAAGATVSSLTFVVFSVMARPRGWTLCLSVSRISGVLRFGGWLTGMSLVSQTSQRLGELVIGKLLDLTAAGIFDKGGALVRLVGSFASPVIHNVLLARVAEESRRGGDLRRGYLQRLTILTAVIWPAFLFLALEAAPLIRLVFGSQWEAAVPVTVWLSIQAMLSTPFLLADNLLITGGLVAGLFWQKLALFGGRLLVLVAVAGLGLPAVSAALLLPAALYLWLNQRAAMGMIGSNWHDLAVALRQPTWLGVVAGFAGWMAGRWYAGAGPVGMVLELLVVAAAMAAAWVGAALLMRGPVNGLCRELLSLIWGGVRRTWASRGHSSAGPSR